MLNVFHPSKDIGKAGFCNILSPALGTCQFPYLILLPVQSVIMKAKDQGVSRIPKT